MQRHLRVGAVQRLPAGVRLDVDRVARGDEGAEVGDRVGEDVAVTVAGQVQRLVEVHGARRVDRDHREVGAVEVGQPWVRGCLRRPRPPPPVGTTGVTSSSAWICVIPARSVSAATPRAGSGPSSRGRTLTTRLPHMGSSLVCRRCSSCCLRARARPRRDEASRSTWRPSRCRPWLRHGSASWTPWSTLCSGERSEAARVLEVPKSQLELVGLNARRAHAPRRRVPTTSTPGCCTTPCRPATLSTAARRRATSRLLVTSSLFGVVGPADRIPAYRLSGDAVLPGLGGVAAHWRESLGPRARRGRR